MKYHLRTCSWGVAMVDGIVDDLYQIWCVFSIQNGYKKKKHLHRQNNTVQVYDILERIYIYGKGVLGIEYSNSCTYSTGFTIMNIVQK